MSPLKDYRKPHMCRIPVLAFKNYYSGPPVLRDRFTAGSRAKREAWPGDALSCFAFSDDYSFGISNLEFTDHGSLRPVRN
jgi:hypothetical protein